MHYKDINVKYNMMEDVTCFNTSQKKAEEVY